MPRWSPIGRRRGRRREGWLRSLGTLLAPAAVACVVAHLALAVWTARAGRAAADWGPYFAIVREFSSGPYNRVVAPPWWVGIPVGGAPVRLRRRRRGDRLAAAALRAENRAALVAIAGMTAFGVATFTYGVRFSTEDYVARADLPAVMVVALWLHLAGRSGLARPARTALAATGFWLAALLIVAAGTTSSARRGARRWSRRCPETAARWRARSRASGTTRRSRPGRRQRSCCSTATGPAGEGAGAAAPRPRRRSPDAHRKGERAAGERLARRRRSIAEETWDEVGPVGRPARAGHPDADRGLLPHPRRDARLLRPAPGRWSSSRWSSTASESAFASSPWRA